MSGLMLCTLLRRSCLDDKTSPNRKFLTLVANCSRKGIDTRSQDRLPLRGVRVTLASKKSADNGTHRMTQQRSWFEVVADCQEAVRRIRAVLTTGGAATPDVQADLDFVILTIRNWLYGRARKLAFLGEDVVEEALFEMIVQLHRDLRSPGFGSMERRFGAYISTTANRILFELRRKYRQAHVLSESESLDVIVGEDGL